jgi:tetratricopeptide (TPR) repeat protein
MAIGASKEAEASLVEPRGDAQRFLYALTAAHRRDCSETLRRLGELRTYEGLSLKGWCLLQTRHFAEAIGSFRAALSIAEPAPTPDVLINIGYAHAALGNARAAIRSTASAVKLAPRNLIASGNLMAFRSAVGDWDAAISEARRIATTRSMDLDAAIFEPMMLMAKGDTSRGVRKLRALSSDRRYFGGSPVGRATLNALLTSVDRQEGNVDLSQTRERLFKALERSEFKAMTPAQMLMWSFSRLSELKAAQELANQLAKANAVEQVTWAFAHERILAQEYDAALELARQWMDADPMSSLASCHAMFLLSDARNEPDLAVAIGRRANHRISPNPDVGCNLAYALALSGKTDEAARVVDGLRLDSPYVVATKGLIEMRRGHVDEGAALYEDAERLAQVVHEDRLASLIAVRKRLALWELGLLASGAVFEGLPAELEDDYRVALYRRRVSALDA